MPCLIFCGHPSSGKTQLARQFRERALLHPQIDNVILINEESACKDQSRNDCYCDSLAEKKTRGSLKSTFDRTVAEIDKRNRTLVILDSLNYIKGYRYELHCISKSNNQNHGIIWVLNQVQVAKKWNKERPEESRYSDELFDELVKRFEPPDARNRWDKPCYTVDVALGDKDSSSSYQQHQSQGTSAAQLLESSVYNMHRLRDAMQAGDQPQAILVSSGTTNDCGDGVASDRQRMAAKVGFKRKVRKPKGSTTAPDQTHEVASNETPQSDSASQSLQQAPTNFSSSTLVERIDQILNEFLAVKALKEGTSTRQQVAADSDMLNQADSVSYVIVGSILRQQHTSKLKENIPIVIDNESLQLKGPVAHEELQNLRQQFLQWISTHPPEDLPNNGSDALKESMVQSFVNYIRVRLS